MRKVWIKPDEYYLEFKRGSSTERYHLACAFRSGMIPTNWLNPHYEQYHLLVAQNLGGWIKKEQEKREDYDANIPQPPPDPAHIEALIEKVRGGYQLDKYEREEWRDHLRQAPVDIEPYQTARSLVGLENPALSTLAAGSNQEVDSSP